MVVGAGVVRFALCCWRHAGLRIPVDHAGPGSFESVAKLQDSGWQWCCGFRLAVVVGWSHFAGLEPAGER